MNAVKIMIKDSYKFLIKIATEDYANISTPNLKKAKSQAFKDVDMLHFNAETDRIIRTKNDNLPIEILTPLPVYKKVCNNIGAILANKQVLISENIATALDYFKISAENSTFDTTYENINQLLGEQCDILSAVIDNNTFCDYMFNVMRPALKIQLESAYRELAKTPAQSSYLGTIDEQLNDITELANQLLIERNK